MKVNEKAKDYRLDRGTRLAGGYGTFAAKQDAESLLRRAVMANLLWEDQYYQTGVFVADEIKNLIPQVPAGTVFDIAIEARCNQGLRHVPLFIAREMARLPEYCILLGGLLPKIITRADQLSDFLALYWRDGKCPLAKQVKLGLAVAFGQFNAYEFGKYKKDDAAVKLRDVLFMVHPKPTQEREELYKQIAENTLPTPDTWEVALSSGADKKATWERLIGEKKLGALAFVRNLRNMKEAKVSRGVIERGFETINPKWLLPVNYMAAARYAPEWTRELEDLMLRGLSMKQKLPGRSVVVVDVSGSMRAALSDKSDMTRLDAAAAMAMLAAEMCEHVDIWVTAGDDFRHLHNTVQLKSYRGFALADQIQNALNSMGGGGIFTRQCLEYIKAHSEGKPARIMVFSDSQDCDYPGKRVPAPFGERNYIIDVGAHTHGVNYDGVWTAEIAGWSQHFLEYIAALEGISVSQDEDS